MNPIASTVRSVPYSTAMSEERGESRETIHSRCSLTDIARIAGVTKMTVSRALRGNKGIKEETRQRILKIADEIGYQQSQFISTVMGQLARRRGISYRTPLMVLVDWPEASNADPVHQEYIQGAEKRARRLGFRTELMHYMHTDLPDRRIDKIFETRDIEGLIINIGPAEPRKIELNWERLVGATTGGRLLHPRHLPRIQKDTFQILNRIIIEVEKRGYQRIGFCLAPQTDKVLGGFESIDGFQVMFFNNYIQKLKKKNQVPLFEMDYGHMETPFKEWYMKYEPELIISTLSGTHDWIQNLGLRMPEDVGFVSLSVPEMGGTVSGIYSSLSSLATTAVDTVVSNLINGNFGLQEIPPRILVPGVWNEGLTVRAPSR